jgi:hypothetical protein
MLARHPKKALGQVMRGKYKSKHREGVIDVENCHVAALLAMTNLIEPREQQPPARGLGAKSTE